jgi:hypothetical protein
LSFLAFVLCLPAAMAQTAYQLPNAGFEQWDGGYDKEPTYWNTFESSDGSYAALASDNHHYRRSGHRPGGSGSYYLTIYTKSIVGIKANGNMTTGRIHAGAMSATSEENYNYTQRSNSDHCRPFTATPDSMYVWVSFYAASSSAEAQVEAIIHGDNDFRAPNHVGDTSKYKGRAVAKTTRTTTSGAQMNWQQFKVPFVYDGNTTADYILVNMTTNNVPGSGEKNDSLSIDDIEFIYSAWLTDISYNGTTVENFDKGTFFYGILVDDISQVTADRIAAATEAADATLQTTIEYRGDSVAVATLVVTAEDGTTKTYTLKFATDPSQTVALDENISASAAVIYPNPASTTITTTANGLLEIVDLQGRIVLRSHCQQGEPVDISHLAPGLYVCLIDGTRIDRLVINQ